MDELRSVAELLAMLVDGARNEEDTFLVEDVTCVTEEAGGMLFYALLDTAHSYSVTVRRED